MSSAAILGRVAKALGVTIPKPPQKPNLGLEDVAQLVGLPAARTDVAGRLFNVRDLGLVDAELKTAQQAVVENLRKVRGEARRIQNRLGMLHVPLVALEACAGRPPPDPVSVPPPPISGAQLRAIAERRASNLPPLTNAQLQAIAGWRA
jgi:hypothetical protein